MSEVTIRCPHCGFSREVPAAKIPPGAVRATCPQCRQGFPLPLPVAPPSLSPPVKSDASPASASASEGKKPPATPLAASASPPPRPVAHPAGPSVGDPAPGQTPPPARKGPRRRTLLPVGELFDKTWTLYKRRFGTLMLVYLAIVGLVLAPIAALAAIGFLLGGSGKGLAFLALAGLVLVPLAATWGGAAFTCAVVDETIGFGEAFARGRRLLLPFVWVFTLLGFLITGGYLLLIIPGILFTLWFFFANTIVAAEEGRGMTALLKSREYVRGFGWAVFGRLFLVSVIGSVLGAIPFVGPILSILFTPYFMLWMFLVYGDLREIKGEPLFACGTGAKATWLVRGAAGYVVFPLLLLALFGPKLYWTVRDLASGDLSALAAPGIEFKLPGGSPAQNWNSPPPAQDWNASPPASETIRPAEFPLLYGLWSGRELGGGGAWQFAFENGGYGVTVQAPDGSRLQGEATIHYDIGERDGAIRVPPGWGILDLDVASSSTGPGVALGAFTVTGDALNLCLGEPGGTVRAEAFASAPGIRCFELARMQGTAGTPEYQFPATANEAPAPGSSAPAADLSDISVFIYAANYTGGVRINGREFKEFGGKRDMQYNYSSFGDDFFQRGENVVEVDYAPLPDLPADHWLLEIHLRIKRGETVLGEWKIEEKSSGSQRYSVLLE